MITEDYVSFEIAKLLREKGFDGRCRDYYNTDGHFYSEDFKSDWNDGGLETIIIFSAPTIQMAMKWLREKYNVFIDISSRFSKNADKDVYFSYSCKKLIDTYESSYEIGDGEWLNYEEACEAAIKYCLENLI